MKDNKDLQEPNILKGFTSLPVEEYDRLKREEQELYELKANFDNKLKASEMEMRRWFDEASEIRWRDYENIIEKRNKKIEEKYNKKIQELDNAILNIGKMGLFDRIFNWDSAKVLLNNKNDETEHTN